MKLKLAMVLIGLMSLTAGAENAPQFGMDNVDIHKAGQVRISIKEKNALKFLHKGVHISVKGETPEDTIDIKAESIDFNYASKEDTEPSTLELSGSVEIKMGDIVIKCAKATIFVAKQEAHFFNVNHLEYPALGTLKADTIKLNFATEELEILDLENIEAPASVKKETAKP